MGCKPSNNVIEIQKNSDYDPIKPGGIWIYQFLDSKSNTLTTFIDTVQQEIDGKNYFKVTRVYSWGDTIIGFVRVENDVVYAIGSLSNTEFVIIPKLIKEETTWLDGDKSWEYKIFSTNASLTTPSQAYTQLLQIRAKRLTGRDIEKLEEYDLFYKKGVGLVATMMNSNLTTYLTKYELKQSSL